VLLILAGPVADQVLLILAGPVADQVLLILAGPVADVCRCLLLKVICQQRGGGKSLAAVQGG